MIQAKDNKTSQIISYQKARSLVSKFAWGLIQQNYEAYSRDQAFVVYKAGYLYKCRKPTNKD